MHNPTDTHNARNFTKFLEWASSKVLKDYITRIVPLDGVRRPRAAVAADGPSMKRRVIGLAMYFGKRPRS